jgi:sulfur-oxidizing protein SoxA
MLWFGKRALIAVAILSAIPIVAAAQDVERELERYRQMLKADPWSNPGLLEVDRGAALWTEKRGPRNVSLVRCDLGRGPGKLKGAFAMLPRYFRDAKRVMDLETRLVWCMEKLQGFSRAEILKRPYSKANEPGTDLEALATFIAHESKGHTFRPSLRYRKEKEALAVGEALFFRRQGPMDFSCATCHVDPGKRIRLQELPVLVQPDIARQEIGDWPAYRVSQSTVMTMQHRITDCYWQMRLPQIDYGSDAVIALTMYLVNQAKGGEITAPQIER